MNNEHVMPQHIALIWGKIAWNNTRISVIRGVLKRRVRKRERRGVHLPHTTRCVTPHPSVSNVRIQLRF